MLIDYLRLIASIVPFVPFLFRRLVQKIYAFRHHYTYEAVVEPKNVVVVGGSFAGLPLLRRLVETLPTGYRAVLVEPSSHFNFVFNFPRYSVIRGHEAKAFIPHDGLAKKAPKGIYKRVQDAVVRITAAPNGGGGEVHLGASSDEPLPYEYLVVATGVSQPFPARARSADKAGGCAELRALQEHITATESVAIIGGGAVGVELAADVKSYYPAKKVVLVHSREKLLPRFGGRLHAHVLPALEKLGVEVVLGERPDIGGMNKAWAVSYGPASLRFQDGREEAFGLVVSRHLLNGWPASLQFMLPRLT
jgi:NADH dehydrogenase FAD-containing subunit